MAQDRRQRELGRKGQGVAEGVTGGNEDRGVLDVRGEALEVQAQEGRKDGVKSRLGRSSGQMEGRCVSAGCAEEEGLH